MSHRRIVGSLLGVSIVGFIAGFILTEPEGYGICPPDKLFTCIEPIGNNIGQPLLMGSIALFLIFLFLFFLPHFYFKAWLTYAAWFIPLSIIIIATSPVRCGGGLGVLAVCLDKELATWWSSGIFVVLSLLVIAITYLRHRKAAAGDQIKQSSSNWR